MSDGYPYILHVRANEKQRFVELRFVAEPLDGSQVYVTQTIHLPMVELDNLRVPEVTWYMAIDEWEAALSDRICLEDERVSRKERRKETQDV